MYKVFKVEGGYQIFWCPSAPYHFNDRVPYNDHIYTGGPAAAYRYVKKLNDRLQAERHLQSGDNDDQKVAWQPGAHRYGLDNCKTDVRPR
jgi:hypothetical protein